MWNSLKATHYITTLYLRKLLSSITLSLILLIVLFSISTLFANLSASIEQTHEEMLKRTILPNSIIVRAKTGDLKEDDYTTIARENFVQKLFYEKSLNKFLLLSDQEGIEGKPSPILNISFVETTNLNLFAEFKGFEALKKNEILIPQSIYETLKSFGRVDGSRISLPVDGKEIVFSKKLIYDDRIAENFYLNEALYVGEGTLKQLFGIDQFSSFQIVLSEGKEMKPSLERLHKIGYKVNSEKSLKETGSPTAELLKLSSNIFIWINSFVLLLVFFYQYYSFLRTKFADFALLISLGYSHSHILANVLFEFLYILFISLSISSIIIISLTYLLNSYLNFARITLEYNFLPILTPVWIVTIIFLLNFGYIAYRTKTFDLYSYSKG